jgi:hypothetical protein
VQAPVPETDTMSQMAPPSTHYLVLFKTVKLAKARMQLEKQSEKNIFLH